MDQSPSTNRFHLTAEQTEFCRRVREIARDELAPLAESAPPGQVNRPLLRAMGRHGLLGRLFPGAADGRAGAQAAAMDLCLLRESLAQISTEAETALALQGLGTYPILQSGTASQIAQWIPRVVSGDAVAAFALSEPGSGSDAGALALAAVPADGGAVAGADGAGSRERTADDSGHNGARDARDTGVTGDGDGDGDGWRLSGEKIWISNAPEADFYTVFARTTPDAGSRGVTAFLVPADRPGLTGEHLDMVSPHPIGHLTFDDVPVGPADVLGEIDGGFRVAMQTLDLFRPSVGAFAVGMAQAALDASIAHAASRQAFGGPLKDLQAVSHTLAEMATRIEAARLLVYSAASAYDAGEKQIAGRSAMAKMFATETAQYVVDSAVQIHGARALQRGHLLEHLYREVRAPRIYEGATEVQRTIIARELYRR
jgi:acyl-CoA dehydrogenase